MSARILKRKTATSKWTIYYDDRERDPWKLPWKMTRKRLAAGDYTIKGFEDLIAVEKKSGLRELLTNLSGSDRGRFDKALQKLSEVPIRAMIIEDSYSNVDYALSVLKKKSGGRARITRDGIEFWLRKIKLRYGIPVLFLDGHGRSNSVLLVEAFKYLYEQAQNYRGARP